MRNDEPHPLKVEEGVAVYADDIGPRLPVLGLRALTQNQSTWRSTPSGCV